MQWRGTLVVLALGVGAAGLGSAAGAQGEGAAPAALPAAGPITFTGTGGSFAIADFDHVLDGPDAPVECDDGVNNDLDPSTNVAQDIAIDWNGQPPDLQCAGPFHLDDSEVASGVQERVLPRLSGTVDATGSISLPESGIELPPAYVYSSAFGVTVGFFFEPTGPATGTIDPATGATELILRLRMRADFAFDCTTPDFEVTISTDPSTAGGHPTAPFDALAGTVTLADATFAIDEMLPLDIPGLGDVCQFVDAAVGLPRLAGNHLVLALTTENVEPDDLAVAQIGLSTGREGHSRGAWIPLDVPVVLDRPMAEPVSIDYTIEAYPYSIQAPVPGTDFIAESGRLTIPAGRTSGQIWVWTKGDRQHNEYSKEIQVRFTEVEGPVSLVSSTRVVVVANFLDFETGLSLSDLEIHEPGLAHGPSSTSVGYVVVGLPEPTTEPVTVEWTTRPASSAVAGSIPGDVLARAGTLVIPTGRSWGAIQVWVRADGVVEPAEGVEVIVTSASVPIDDGTARVLIRDALS